MFQVIPNDLLRLIFMEVTAKGFYSSCLLNKRCCQVCLDDKYQKRQRPRLLSVVRDPLQSGGYSISTLLPNGEEEGPQEMYWSNGQLHWRWFTQNGLKEGLEVNYYVNGQINRTCHWERGLRQGLDESYGYYGTLQHRYNWQNSRQEGLQEEYDINGFTRSKYNCVSGKKEGPCYGYNYYNGTLNCVSIWSNGVFQGYQ